MQPRSFFEFPSSGDLVSLINPESPIKIGEGSFGTVYKVKGTNPGTFYAVKVQENFSSLSESDSSLMREIKESRESTEREINALEMLKQAANPYIILYIGSYDVHGSKHIVMKYCELGDLKEYRQANTFDTATQYYFVSCLWQGLNAIHGLDLVHADLKPGNILVTSENGKITPKVCDFGSTRKMREFVSAVITTLIYCAPELFPKNEKNEKEDEKNNFSTDVYSMGLVCYWVVAGKSHVYQEDEIIYLNDLLGYGCPRLVFPDELNRRLQKFQNRDEKQSVDEIVVSAETQVMKDIIQCGTAKSTERITIPKVLMLLHPEVKKKPQPKPKVLSRSNSSFFRDKETKKKKPVPDQEDTSIILLQSKPKSKSSSSLFSDNKKTKNKSKKEEEQKHAKNDKPDKKPSSRIFAWRKK